MRRATSTVGWLLVLGTSLLRAQQYEGDSCSLGGASATCTAFSRCAVAVDLIRTNRVKTCSFTGNDPIICCPTAAATPRPAAATSTRPTTTTTQYVPTEADYVFEDERARCPPIPPERTAQKTGRKAFDKCIEYQELVYPCVSSQTLALGDEMVRADHCGHSATELVVGGVDTKTGEFPHMVMLGYGDNIAQLQWLCGGTLISDYFVLTAGHCTFSREYGDVTHVRVGALRRSDADRRRTYRVAQVIKHPDYKPPSKYSDIALLKTGARMALDRWAVPACLDAGEPPHERALATGWGATQYKGANADVLQKVVLEKFTTSECRAAFPPGERNMRLGFQQDSQLCYGDHEKSRDTCQGDSGGPLQAYNKRVHCMYWVVGVTSFGKACGFAGQPGVYTRVASFTPWIEGVVWP